jgi:hypothetical protein
MLPAVQPEHQNLIVLAKKNKGNYYPHYNFILTQPPSAPEGKPHGLNEIKHEFASYDVDNLRPLK